ncbi:MAG TPA: phosphodiester glycosidase family protein [Verrucomicrobiae bacterium]|nr:phosphodiester glycosidase family protein [Verrucomicrobiae bacterium]
MTTSTAEINCGCPLAACGPKPARYRAGCAIPLFPTVLLALFALVWFQGFVFAGPVPGPWTPAFKGVDLANGTNNPSVNGNFPRLQVVRCVRVDLTDPDVRLFSTAKASNYVAESTETYTLSIPNYLRQNSLQIACDANFYNANPGGADPTAEGIPAEVFGLQISSGVTVSAATAGDAAIDQRYASILFTTNNQPSVVFVNKAPGTNTAGIYTAVTGFYPIVSNGINVGDAASASYPDPYIHQVQPRTAYGISRDNRYLYLMTIDGRQTGYSDGALDSETAYWLLQFGAWNAINMDGGGSTALYLSDPAGNAVGLNHSSYLAAFGRERYIGSHFGVQAKPLPGYINDVVALPDDTAATITWTTTNASTTLVQYGLTPNLGSSSAYSSAPVTNHAVLLSGLSPGTQYYFRVFSSDGSGNHGAGIFSFTTTNYAASVLLFDLTNVWMYGTANLDGVNWTAPSYDDSSWNASGPGLLWVDTRGSANANIPVPMVTQMPSDPSTGNPYPTYYFRTHFNFTNSSKGITLLATDYLDDGAVFYLNGTEIYRLRMPATPIAYATLASGYPCSNSVDYGDAVCPDNWTLSGDATTSLLAGDNVFAVEAHNYNSASPDITFGLALSYSLPFSPSPQLSIQQSGATVTVSWTRGGFTLQQSGSPAGPWSNVPGPVVSSPFVTASTGNVQYFRLIK